MGSNSALREMIVSSLSLGINFGAANTVVALAGADGPARPWRRRSPP